MKKILVIGSTVVDVVIYLVDHLPATGEDVHVRSQRLSLGGCAYNVSDSIRHFGVPYTLFSPVGQGVYGQFVQDELAKRGITSPIPSPDTENGCCYCFVEDTGERSFVCYHGAEYLFRPEWFDLLDTSEIGGIYICGLEIEETTGPVIVDFLERHPEIPVYFGPGPRLTRIDPSLLSRLYAISPILHLNDTEVLEAEPACDTVSAAAHALYAKTHNTVIVTMGRDGCYYYDGRKEEIIPPVPAVQADTIGAGDSHIGSVIACLTAGDPLPEALRKANRVSAAVVEQPGALLPDDLFRDLALI